MEKTAYETLGVSETATDEEIKKQYHTLMRNLHPDSTIQANLTPKHEEENLERVKEYNDAYSKLSKGKRADYDKKLAEERGSVKVSSNINYREPSDFKAWNFYSEEDISYRKKDFTTQQKSKDSNIQRIIEQLLLNQIDDLMKDILNSGFSFSGSFTTDPKQELKQNYWKLKGQRETLERDLRMAEQEEEIEFMKKNSTNEIQLNMEFKNLSSKIVSFESKRNADLASAQQNYVFHASKRFVTRKKREKLRQQLAQEQEQINAKYNMMIEMYKEKQRRNRMELEKYRTNLKAAIEANPKVMKIKTELSKVQMEFNSIEMKLGYQAKTSDYTSSYGERSRVSV